MPEIAGVFRRPFAEQVAAFRLRLGNLVPTARWDDLRHNAHDRAFMVAGATKADLLADLGAAVDKAIAEGTGFEAFKGDFRAIVERHGWHGWTGEGTPKGEAWRMRTIYRTNMRTTYMAGRHAQLTEGRFKYWVYRHGGSVEPRLHHLAWDGLVLPPDHPFWATHYPPNGWGCSCRVFGARSLAGAKRRGGDPSVELGEGWDRIDPKTGTPAGIGKGWDYAPGRTVTEDVRVLAETLKRVPPPLGRALGESAQGRIEKAWAAWIEETIEGRSHAPGLLGTVDPGDVRALADRGLAPKSAEVLVRPGLLRGPKARRHAEKGDALTRDDWRALPELFRRPRAVFLDLSSENLIYLLDAGDGAAQLAMNFQYVRKGDAFNMVVSAYRVEIGSLRGRLSAGQIALIRGVLE